MAEEWGRIVIRASRTTADLFSSRKTSEGLESLAIESGLDVKILDRGHGVIEEVDVRDGYIQLAYDCSEWVRVSEAFVSKGEGIEFYARHGNEYGTLSFLALTEEGRRIGFEFDQGGDAMEDESYRERIIGQINEWKSIIPESVKNTFPKLADVSIEEIFF